MQLWIRKRWAPRLCLGVALVAGGGSLLCLPGVARAAPASAEGEAEAPLVTDRPGNGNAASTVPRWALQVEASGLYLYEGTAGGSFETLSFPTMLRFGVLDMLELRLGSGWVGFDLSGEEVVSTDTSVGAKLQLLHNCGPVPDLALMTDVFLPTGGGVFTADQVVPEARVAASWALLYGFGLLLNAGAALPEDTDGRFVQMLYVVNLSYVPPVGEERLSVFVESFGTVATGSRATLGQLDVGAAYLLTDTLQLDFFTQHGLTDVAPDFQGSVGISKRF